MFVGMRDRSVSNMVSATFLVVVCVVCSLSSVQDVRADETVAQTQEEVAHVREFNPAYYIAQSSFNISTSLYEIRSKAEGNFLFSPFHVQAMFEPHNPTEVVSEVASGSELPHELQLVETAFRNIVASFQENENITFTFEAYPDDSNVSLPEFPNFTHTSFASVHFDEVENANAETPVQETAFNVSGNWEYKFDHANTKSEPFFLTPTQTKDVQMMHLASGNFIFVDSVNLDCKVIELPYKGNKLSLIVLLPNKLDGLAALESKLSSLDIAALIFNTTKHEVSVSLPKFKIEHSYSKTRNDSKVEERAVFGVNEEGTECAAPEGADNVGIHETHESAVHEVFKADHPFLFVLFERWTHIIFFVGRVASP